MIPNYKPIPLSSIPSTIGVNLSKVTIQGLDVTFWDIGGSMRSIWDQYYNEADGIIFIIDTNERNRFGEAASTLSLALNRADTAKVPILILANKKDKSNAARATDIMDQVCKPAGLGGSSTTGGGSTSTGTSTPIVSATSSTNTNALSSASSPMLSSTVSSSLANNITIDNLSNDNTTPNDNEKNNLLDHTTMNIPLSSSTNTNSNLSSLARRREYRILEVSALTSEGVRDSLDWIVRAAKSFANERENTTK